MGKGQSRDERIPHTGPAQSLRLPDDLRLIWSEWSLHIEDLGTGAKLLKDNLVYEQPDVAGGSYFECPLSRRFKAENLGADGVIPPYFSWQTDQRGHVEMVFIAEREPEVIDLRAHTGGEEMWEILDTIRAKIAEGIVTVRESINACDLHVKGLQPLAASVAVALDSFSFVHPKMARCERCPRAASGVFTRRKKEAALSKK